MRSEEIYDPEYVRGLFDEMSRTYGITNSVTSFGFAKRWRRQCVGLGGIQPGMTVYDLMTGMGECWNLIDHRLAGRGEIVALDISEEMCKRAEEQRAYVSCREVEVVNDDFLENGLPDASADCVISSFGLKTFSDEQKKIVAQQIARILKPGGRFSLLEISIPTVEVLRKPYMGYLKYCIPCTGKMFLGNPDNYRMLGVYTERFGNCQRMGEYLAECGLRVEMKFFFYGCATGVCGVKLD
jgi:demethylmenaquinone methyltransferase/2-methoxy-6-polyprenyl-1,4-benzoquinol methylase